MANFPGKTCSERVYSGTSYRGRRRVVRQLRPCRNTVVAERVVKERRYQEVAEPTPAPAGWEGVPPTTRDQMVEVEVVRYFCGQHDPVRRAEAQAAKRAQEERDHEARLKRDAAAAVENAAKLAAAQVLIGKLGVGKPAEWGFERYTGGVVLTQAEAAKLAARLLAAEA